MPIDTALAVALELLDREENSRVTAYVDGQTLHVGPKRTI